MSIFVVICGLSFSGKSTLARTIAETLGFDEADRQIERRFSRLR